MKYLLFAFVLNVCACTTTGTTHAPANTDDADRLKALAVFGVTSTGTGYIGEESLMSIQCVPSGSDATTDTKAALRLARDEVIKMRCGTARTNNFIPENLILSLSGRVSCIKITAKVSDIKC
jgi:hypothetical protein